MTILDNPVLISILAFLVVDKGLYYLQKGGVDLRKLARQIQDLYDWHAKEDSRGVKMWYGDPALADAVKSLAKSTERHIYLTEKMLDRLESHEIILKEIREEVTNTK